ncbi:cell wall hydrolase [Erythrobacteraceae bacterium CFH 75059]|nr:cell wall hydrolase [Erythrobacteraceae bacterium CFH 75059]
MAVLATLFTPDEGTARAQEAPGTFQILLPEQPVADPVPVFLSREVVQPLAPSAAEEQRDAPAADRTAASLRDLVAQTRVTDTLSEEMRCLAGAIYFEARGEPLHGQLAVAKVVINRKQSSRFPDSYCGVVYQRAQFSFVRNGRMPPIPEHSPAWAQAKAIAQIAHYDSWDSAADEALYFHANYVRPDWARRRVAAATINRHIFYR